MRTALFILGVAACTAPSLPDAEVLSVTPERVWRGADVPVVIDGRNFYPEIDVDARGFGTNYDRDWGAFLVGESGKRSPLAAVSLESEEQLRAIVEAGLPAGDYLLELETPGGDVVSSSARLTVAESQEAAYSIRYYDPPAAYVAGQQVRFLIEGVGLDGELVVKDIPVAISLAGAATRLATTVAFDDVEFTGGTGFTGIIPDGSAVLIVDLLAPGRLDVLAESPPGADELQPGPLTLVVGGGDDLPATVDLPIDVARDGVVAGEVFDVTVTVYDALGKMVDESLELQLSNTCGGFTKNVVVRGATVVPVALTRATTANCPADSVFVSQGAVGDSDDFRVRGGPATDFEVFTLTLDLVAGVESDGAVILRPRDAYDNTTNWTGSLTITDSLGTLTDVTCVAGPQVFGCSATATLAGEDITVEALGSDGLVGTLSGYSVAPSPTTQTLQVNAPSPVRAGDAIDVDVTYLDPFGNQQLPQDIVTTGLGITTQEGDASCAMDFIDIEGIVHFGCVLTVARSAAELVAEGAGPTAGLTGTGSLDVDNGVLSSVMVSTPAGADAGQGFMIGLSAFDAYGNPYKRQDDGVLDLSEPTATLLPTSAPLGADGTAVVSASILRAGSWAITAEQDAAALGTSAPITIVPGPTSELAVDIGAPWGRVGEPVTVTVEAVDAYANRTGLNDTVNLVSDTTITLPRSGPLVNGVWSIEWTWLEKGIDETLTATTTTTGHLGASTALYVVQHCPADGPSAVMTFASEPFALACYDPIAELATVVADLGASTGGALPVVGYAVSTDEQAVSGAASAKTLTFPSVGSYAVRGLVVRADGCAAEVDSSAWVGFDDGTATGPIDLQATVATLSTNGVAPVTITDVTDCAGDPASGASVFVRSSVGDLIGPLATGTGNSVVLGPLGEVTMDWRTTGQVSAGTADLTAWTTSGSAGGLLQRDVLGDAVLPTIHDQNPTGFTEDVVATIVLETSEPMLVTTVVPANFAIAGPTAASITSATLSGDDDLITLVLSVPADGALGGWYVTATDALRDQAGNRLAGTWSGARAPYVGAFGDVGGVLPVLTCPSVVPSGGVFRPDGDDGLGADADHVVVSLEVASVPAWWVAEVYDTAGALLRQDWNVPLGLTDVWAFDGRDDRGHILENGTYTLEIRPDDGAGNRGTGCIVQTIVDNPSGLPVGGFP